MRKIIGNYKKKRRNNAKNEFLNTTKRHKKPRKKSWVGRENQNKFYGLLNGGAIVQFGSL